MNGRLDRQTRIDVDQDVLAFLRKLARERGAAVVGTTPYGYGLSDYDMPAFFNRGDIYRLVREAGTTWEYPVLRKAIKEGWIWDALKSNERARPLLPQNDDGVLKTLVRGLQDHLNKQQQKQTAGTPPALERAAEPTPARGATPNVSNTAVGSSPAGPVKLAASTSSTQDDARSKFIDYWVSRGIGRESAEWLYRMKQAPPEEKKRLLESAPSSSGLGTHRFGPQPWQKATTLHVGGYLSGGAAGSPAEDSGGYMVRPYLSVDEQRARAGLLPERLRTIEQKQRFLQSLAEEARRERERQEAMRQRAAEQAAKHASDIYKSQLDYLGKVRPAEIQAQATIESSRDKARADVEAAKEKAKADIEAAKIGANANVFGKYIETIGQLKAEAMKLKERASAGDTEAAKGLNDLRDDAARQIIKMLNEAENERERLGILFDLKTQSPVVYGRVLEVLGIEDPFK